MRFLLWITLFAISVPTYAQTGPYTRTSKANLAQKIVHVLDNSTIGAAQTVFGAGHILVLAALKPLTDEPVRFKTHKDETSEVSQLSIETQLPWFYGAYSLGLFQVGGDHHDHEGGHSVASAALGPLYLPSVAVSYLAEGYDSSFFEDWADLEAGALPYMNTGSAQVGLGKTQVDGQSVDVVAFKFSLEQR